MATSPATVTEILIRRALQLARELSGLEIAYVSEFREGSQYVRHTDARETLVELPLDEAIPLEGSYCQRMVDGRISGLIRDTRADPVTAALAATAEAHLGAYIGAPVRLPDGRLWGTFCCASSHASPDLSEHHVELLRMLARMVGEQLGQVERARADDTAQQEFLASVSHDLRTPLKAVSFLAEDLAAGDEDLDPGEVGRLILGEAERVLGMVDDMLLVTRQRAGALTVTPRAADVAQLARDAARSSALAAGADGGRVRCEVPPEPVEADVDPDRILQALRNLVDNALKYSPDGGPVVVRARAEDTTVVFEVSDEGIGLDPADVARLGERFFRASGARERGIPGIGLGVATAQAVAESHEGVLSVDSVRGEGSTFRLRLPARRPA